MHTFLAARSLRFFEAGRFNHDKKAAHLPVIAVNMLDWTMNFPEILYNIWPHLVTLAIFLVIMATAVHILYKKRDTRAAAGWLGLVWFAPVLGVCLYWIFGVNRIKRRAMVHFADKQSVPLPKSEAAVNPSYIQQMCGEEERNSLVQLSRMTDKLTRQPLMRGNKVTPLINGDEAYPCMLSCIEAAQHSITMCSYIFDNDSWGSRFRAALRDAGKRGVEVKVLIDGVGARYSFPPITWGLRRDGLNAAEFMKTLLPWSFQYFNLRNHRKIMVIDGRLGFTGGMNIRKGNCLADNPRHPIQDLHFLIEGPVVAELQRAFAEDWTFTTRQVLEGEKWYPHIVLQGDGVARGISDGPDEDFNKLRMVILAAVATAQNTIQIMHSLFSAGRRNRFSAAHRSAARCGDRNPPACCIQSQDGEVGIRCRAGGTAAGRMPGIPDPAAV